MRNPDGTNDRENGDSPVEQDPDADCQPTVAGTSYEAVFDAVDDAVFLFAVERDDEAFRFTFQQNNPAHESSTGLTVSEYHGQTPSEIFGEDEGEAVAARYQECVETRETLEYEETLDHPSGTLEWHTKLTPVTEDGDVTTVVGIARDITEQKTREQEVTQSRKRLRALFDEAPDGLVVHDADGNVLDVNDTLCEMLDYTQEELRSMTVSDFEVGIDEETLLERWNSMETGPMQKIAVDGTHRRKDGSTYPVEVWVSKVSTGEANPDHDGTVAEASPDHDGTVAEASPDHDVADRTTQVRFIALARDISERKSYERELTAREEKYRSLFSESRDALILLDRDGFVECNQTAVDLFDVESPGTFSEFAPWELSPPTQPDGRDSLTAAKAYMEQAFEEGSAFFEWTHERADGTAFTAEVKLSQFEVGDQQLLHALVRDITERKAQERELGRYKRFVESASDIMTVADVDGTIRYESPVVRDILGYDPEDLVGENAFEYIHPDDVDEAVELFTWGIENAPDEVHRHELRFRDAAGEWRWMELRASIELDNPAIEGVLINNTDITERKRAQQSLQNERDTFADGPVVVFQWQDEEGWPVEYVSENVEDIFGYTPEQLLSGELQYAELIHEDDLQRVTREVREHSDTERFRHEPYRIVTSDGTVKWVMDHTKIVREGGEITHRLGYLVDITQRKHYEQQLAALHEATRAFIDAESKQEVADSAVRAASESLDFTFPAVWFPAEDDSELKLRATTPDGQQLLDEAGTPSPAHPRGDWLWEAFESGDTVVRSSIPPEEVAADIPLQSAIVLPLGDHGVLVCAGEGDSGFDDQDVRLAETLARNVQVALDQLEHRAALERQQQFTEDLLDAIDDIGYVLDREGNLKEWNAALEAVAGYTSEEIASMNATEFFAEEDTTTVEQAVREAFETGHARMELDLLTAEGETIPYEFTANVFESPSGERVMAGIGRNRTAHVEYERELEAERDFLDTVIESVPFPFYVLDVDDYTIEYANSQAIVREGDTCHVMTHDRDLPCDQGENPIACPIAAIRETREPTVVEHTHTDEDGNERCFQVHAAPIFDEDGEITQIAESNIDITDRVKYEKRLEEQRDNLEMLNQVVRHDIRNDLQLIQTYTELLEPHVDEKRQQYVETVLRSAENAVALTTTARELAEVMLQSDAEIRRVSLDRTLEQQVEEVRSGHSEAVVTVDGSLPSTTVVADDMLGSVFRNLLKNAIEHNNKTVPKVTVSADEHDGHVEVRVADNGPGIPDAQKEEIFGKGEKGLESEGTGIGLYLVQSLVDAYGGDVWVEDRVTSRESESGGGETREDSETTSDLEGAVFVVRLPVAE